MSNINGITSNKWIKQNRPETGWFRVYWKDVVNPHSGGATIDESEGEGLRYEWEYKDGKRADGVARSWYPSGQLKEKRTYKDGKQDGSYTFFYEDGQKGLVWNYKDGKQDGLQTNWYENGQKNGEVIFKDGKPIKLIGQWNEDGSVNE